MKYYVNYDIIRIVFPVNRLEKIEKVVTAMKRFDNKYTVTGGEAIIVNGEKHGRLVVENGKMFCNDGTIHPISPKDILFICVTNDWFGIMSFKGLKLLLDAKIYMPKKEAVA